MAEMRRYRWMVGGRAAAVIGLAVGLLGGPVTHADELPGPPESTVPAQPPAEEEPPADMTTVSAPLVQPPASTSEPSTPSSTEPPAPPDSDPDETAPPDSGPAESAPSSTPAAAEATTLPPIEPDDPLTPTLMLSTSMFGPLSDEPPVDVRPVPVPEGWRVVSHTAQFETRVLEGQLGRECLTRGWTILATADAFAEFNDAVGEQFWTAFREFPSDPFAHRISAFASGTQSWNDLVAPVLSEYTRFGVFEVPASGGSTVAFLTYSGLPRSDRYGDPPELQYCSPAGIARFEADLADYRVWAPGGFNTEPVADFEWALSPTTPRTVVFTNTSSDPDGDTLTSAWSFGDGTSSSETSPTHTFAGEVSSFEVTLTVNDGTVSRSITKTVMLSLTVNSTGDAANAQADAVVCDTGGTVGEQSECTLRAAIQAANAAGGGTISFAIDGTPRIAVGSPLPSITAPGTAIDGTSQPTGVVEIVGPGSGTIITTQATGVRLTGLVLDRATVGIAITGGSAAINAVVLGADASGTVAGALEVGVEVHPGAGAGTSITDSTFASVWGAQIAGSGVEVRGNRIGVTAGGAAFASTNAGVVTFGAGTAIVDNTIWASTIGVIAMRITGSQSGAGAQITGNRIGLAADGTTPLAGMGEGIRIEGASGVTVSSNRVATDDPAISVVGLLVSEISGSGDNQQFSMPNFYDTSGEAASLDGATVSGNTILTPGAGAAAGIFAWGEGSGVSIQGNTITGSRSHGIRIVGGRRHTVAGNAVGATGGAPTTGVEIADAGDVTIGGAGGGNTVWATTRGIVLSGAAAPVAVRTNTVGAVGGDATHGIALGSGADGAALAGNVVRGFASGISSQSAGATITDNTVTGAANEALAAAGRGLTITGNSVGRDGTTVVGTPGSGIVIAADSTATVADNTVLASGGDGIASGSELTTTLRGNRISGSQRAPIVPSRNAPPDPEIAAAIRLVTGSSARTVLIVRGLPGVAGELEIFANDSCADGEAEVVLGVRRSVADGEYVRVISLAARPSADNFTATFTTTANGTSALSACTSIEPHADDDGDGSPDVLDALVQAHDDPQRAVIVTDDDQLLLVETSVGTLTGVGALDTPAPLPNGVTLPYGAIGFAVEGVKLGGTALVHVVALTGPTTSGNGYAKYGLEQPTDEPHWFRFDGNDGGAGAGNGGPGAAAGPAVDVPGFGIRRGYLLTLQDGARGDSNGFTDGRIVDPGGPAIFAADGDDPGSGDGEQPGDTAAPTTTPIPDGGGDAGTSGTDEVTTTSTVPATLPATGAEAGPLGSLAAAALGAGLLLVVAAHRRRTGQPSGDGSHL